MTRVEHNTSARFKVFQLQVHVRFSMKATQSAYDCRITVWLSQFLKIPRLVVFGQYIKDGRVQRTDFKIIFPNTKYRHGFLPGLRSTRRALN